MRPAAGIFSAPAAGPYLVNGGLSVKAAKGKAVFEKAGCAHCHPAPLYTDLKMYNIGTRAELDRSDRPAARRD